MEFFTCLILYTIRLEAYRRYEITVLVSCSAGLNVKVSTSFHALKEIADV